MRCFTRFSALRPSDSLGPGSQSSAGYSILYRSFVHGRMKAVCEALDVPVLGKSLARQLRKKSVSSDMRAFAGQFAAFQDARHLADYDPTAEFSQSTVERLVDAAEIAIAAFDRVDPDERSDVLALMLSNPRA
jgi:hypothetical protein